MADPRLEDGYARIANELLEALTQINLSNYERRIFTLLSRMIFGYEDRDKVKITQRAIAFYTKINTSHVSTAIKKLREKNMIKVDGKNYMIQLDYDKWRLPNQGTIVTLMGKKKIPKKESHIKEIKENKKKYMDSSKVK